MIKKAYLALALVILSATAVAGQAGLAPSTPQPDQAQLARLMGELSNNLAKAQGVPQKAGVGGETLDHVISTASKVLNLLGQQTGVSNLESAQKASEAAQSLSDMIKHFRSVAQSSAKQCDYSAIIKLGDEAAGTFNQATGYLERARGSERERKEDLKDIPMTNYVTNWINKRLTGNEDERAKMKAQQLIGQMEQACQTAVTLTDLRSQVHSLSDAQRALSETVAPMFKSFMLMQGKKEQPIPGTDTTQGKAATAAWTVAFNNSVYSVPKDNAGLEDAADEAMNTVIKEAAGTTQDVLTVLNSLNKDLLNYQKQLLIFAEIRPVTENGQTTLKLACPEGGPSVVRPAQGTPGHDAWTPLPTFIDYVGKTPVIKSICGYTSPARALQIMASITAADAQLDALTVKLNSVGTRVVATQATGENIQMAKDEATARRSLVRY